MKLAIVFLLTISLLFFGSLFHHARDARIENIRGEERMTAVTRIEEGRTKKYEQY